MMPPTPRQQDLLRFITGYQVAHGGVSPSFAECASGMGFKSKTAVYRLLQLLEERGLVRRLPHRERAIEVLAVPAIPFIGADPLYFVPIGPPQ